jgi:hypothetical protein
MNSQVEFLAVQDIHFDPRRFQYKLHFSKNGSTGSLSGVQAWNDILAGIILVWIDPQNGKIYVVNGHNRLAKAKELGVQYVLVRRLECSNEREARAMGALTNLGEGQGDCKDCAKFLRDSSEYTVMDLQKFGVNIKLKLVRDGIALSKLERSLFQEVIDGELPIDRGVILGSLAIPEQLQVMKLVKVQEKKRKITNEVLVELIDCVKNAPIQQQTLFDLFGSNEVSQSLALEKLNLTANIRTQLSKNKRLFALVNRNAKSLEEFGNVVNLTANDGVSQESALVLGLFDQLKHQSGEVSELINQGVIKLTNGESMKAATDWVINQLIVEIPRLLKLA